MKLLLKDDFAMGQPKKAMPDYRHHVSGQAVVAISGKTHYLGEHDSPESRARYFALLQAYAENAYTMPDEDVTRHKDAPISVRCVTAEFREYVKVKYANSDTHRNRMTNLCTLLDDEYGDDPASDFGPRKLSEIRDEWRCSVFYQVFDAKL